MRKSRESRWTCKTPSELLRCSSVGKAAAQSAEPDQESSAAVSALRRRRRMAHTRGGSSSFGNFTRHPVNFTPSPGARPWVPSPPRRLEGLSCSQVAHINITKTNHSPPQTIHPEYSVHPPKTVGPPRDGGPPHTTRKLETYTRISYACKSPAAGAAAPSRRAAAAAPPQ